MYYGYAKLYEHWTKTKCKKMELWHIFRWIFQFFKEKNKNKNIWRNQIDVWIVSWWVPEGSRSGSGFQNSDFSDLDSAVNGPEPQLWIRDIVLAKPRRAYRRAFAAAGCSSGLPPGGWPAAGTGPTSRQHDLTIQVGTVIFSVYWFLMSG